MLYNGLQTTVRKRFKNSYSWEVNYTLGTSEATHGGDLSAYYIASSAANVELWLSSSSVTVQPPRPLAIALRFCV